jgi:hypothetical protein
VAETRDTGVEANGRLTAMMGVALFVLLAAEDITILRVPTAPSVASVLLLARLCDEMVVLRLYGGVTVVIGNRRPITHLPWRQTAPPTARSLPRQVPRRPASAARAAVTGGRALLQRRPLGLGTH